MPVRRLPFVIVSLACITSCAMQPRALSCSSGMNAMKSELLYFGTASPRGPVTPGQWTGFVEQTVTPRFPDGFTVWQADGQWRGESGKVEREASYVLNVVHAGSAADDQSFAAIIAAYKTQFQQQAVLRVQDEVCANIP